MINMASRMQDPTPGARGDMLFSARLDTALATLDDLPAHIWAIKVCMSRGLKVGQDMATVR
jgi:hypothetical protein